MCVYTGNRETKEGGKNKQTNKGRIRDICTIRASTK